MKRTLFLGCLMVLCAQIVFAQEKIEAPVWNVGDKWVFSQGMTVEVIGTDDASYTVRFPNETILFDKGTLNKTFRLFGKRREPYKDSQRRLFDFPLSIGKGWKDKYSVVLKWEDTYESKTAGSSLGDETMVFENYKVLGWEEVEVRTGKLKAIKVEYKKGWNSPTTGSKEGKAWYWYAPGVKYLVKYQYEKNQMWSKETNWELISFELAK